MPRPRSPNRDKAKELWRQSEGTTPLKDIAANLDVSESLVRKWKNQDKWERENKVMLLNVNSNVTETSSEAKHPPRSVDEKIAAAIEENEDLSEKQKLFCVYYAYSLNATQSYLKAYECEYSTALVNGPTLLGNTRIKKEVERLKRIKLEAAMVDMEDLFELHLRIASADMKNFVKWGNENNLNTVKLVDSDQVDGMLVSEVSEGRDGMKVKLRNSDASLKFLERYLSEGSGNNGGGVAEWVETILEANEGAAPDDQEDD